MSCVQLTDAQKKKNIYRNTSSGRSKAREFSHIMRNTKFDLTRKNVDCTPVEVWTQVSKLLASDLCGNDNLGISVDMDIYGEYIISGCNDSTSPYSINGAVYIYKKNSNGTYGTLLMDTEYIETYKLLASDRQSGDFFGGSVDVYEDYIAIGATYEDTSPRSNNGAVYIYKKPSGADYYGTLLSGNTYTETYKLLASDRQTNDYFGEVKIFSDYIIVGAFEQDSSPTAENGAVYIFKKNIDGSYGTFSSGIIYTETYKLLASDKQSGNRFGSSVNILDDYIIVGAPNGEASYIYRKPSGANYYGTLLSGNTYIETYKLLASDNENFDYFGYSVFISKNYMAIGAYSKNTYPTTDNGAVYIYKKNEDGSYGIKTSSIGKNYKENFKITATDKDNGDNFGVSVAMIDDTLVSGAFKVNTVYGAVSGALYLYKKEFFY